MTIDGGATHHDIVDDGKAAFAANPIALAVFDAAVGQYSSLVKPHASAVELLGQGHFIRMEEVPDGSVQDFIGGVTKYVDDGIRRVQNISIFT